ncbi:MAG: ABC-F family ATP-binding cassette domain-containing protein [bacterium]
MTLFTADSISRRFDDQVIVDQVSLTINSGQRIGLVGRNGCGKTTLFDIIVGRESLDSGSISRAKRCLIDYAQQDISRHHQSSLHEFVSAARPHLLAMQQEIELLQHELEINPSDESCLDRLGLLQEQFESSGGFTFDNDVKIILDGLGFPPSRHADQLRLFSGGEKNRAALARVLAGEGNLILLDEPTNHLDIESTQWLEEFLQNTERTFIVVSHDRSFLQAVVSDVWELRHGRIESYTGGFDNYLTQRAERRRLHAHAYRHQQEEIKRIEEFIRRNMAGQKTKQAQSRLKYLSRIKRLPPPRGDGSQAVIKMESSGRSYAHILEIRNVDLGYGSNMVVEDVTFDLFRGDRVGLIGRNGSGKTTILKALIGELTPAAGELRLGNKVDVAYFDQELSDLDLQQNVIDSVWELDPTAEAGKIRSFLARFGFSGDDVLKMVSSLSGGERTKLSLARLLYHPANFIIFDEPTNHLDMDSREALEEALQTYEGSYLIVSHDRYFLDQVVNRILHLQDGRIKSYDGDYTYFRARSQPTPTSEVQQPGKSKEDYLAFKEKSKQRGRLKKDLAKTREDIAAAEDRIRQLEVDIAENISADDWEQLHQATELKEAMEEQLLKLYARLEELQGIDLD